MYLARLRLNKTRIAIGWVARPYRVHQRLSMAYEDDPRMLFRIEDALAEPLSLSGIQIIVQSQHAPDWEDAFADFPVLLSPPESKPFSPTFSPGQVLAFRLRANPTIKLCHGDFEDHAKETNKRMGLYKEEGQVKWLQRKAAAGGFEVLRVQLRQEGLIKDTIHREGEERHALKLLAVTFDGLLRVTDAPRFTETLCAGIGSGKSFGFGLLSLARPQ